MGNENRLGKLTMFPKPVINSFDHSQMDTKQGESCFCAHIIMHMRNMYIIPIIMQLSIRLLRI